MRSCALVGWKAKITVQNLIAHFSDAVKANLDKPAVYCEDKVLSYSELSGVVREWSCLLYQQGVRPGDHIAVVLPNSIEFVVVMMAAADLGFVLVPFSTTLPAVTLLNAMGKAGIQYSISNEQQAKELNAWTHEKNGCAFFCSKGGFKLHNAEGKELELSPIPENFLELGTLDSPYIMTMTSGSTAEPKPIVLTQKTKILRAQTAIALYAVTLNDRVMVGTPLYHSLAERLVLISLLCGARLVIMGRFSAEQWLSTVNRRKVSFTMAASSQLIQLKNKLESGESLDLSSLRCLVSSSAQLSLEEKTKLLSFLNCRFHECYGTSEIATVTDLNDSHANKLSSVGKAIKSVDIKVLKGDMQLAKAGEVGEIICKTPMAFSGYYGSPEVTEASYWQGYFRTGDMGELDTDGFLYYRGRKKELIITAGINVYPLDVEKALLSCEGVAECAVYPLDDDLLGEVVAAAVVLEAGAKLNERALSYHCLQYLADYQLPRKITFMEQLPKNAMGKIMRRKLAEKEVTA